MADSVVTLRPNATDTSTGWTLAGGAITHNSATSDNSDSTYSIQPPGGANALLLEFGASGIPASDIIHSVTFRVRMSDASAAVATFIELDPLAGSNSVLGFIAPGSAIVTWTLAAQASRPNGTPWTTAAVDALLLEIVPNTGGALRIYEVYADVHYNQAPSVVVTGPAGTVTTSTRPAITWNYSDPEGDPQERYQVKVFTAAQYGAGGFDPETSAATWDSGEVVSSATSATPADLANSTTYRAYVKVADAGSGGRYGAWSYAGFSIDVDPLATPALSVPFATPATATIDSLVVQARANLLDLDDANFEGGTGGWGWYHTGCSLAQSTAAAKGAHGLAATCTTAGDIQFNSPKVVASGGELVTAMVHITPGSTARSGAIALEAFDSGGSSLGSVIRTFTEIAGEFLRVAVTGLLPGATATVDIAVVVNGCALSEVHNIDLAAIVPGTANHVDNSSFELDAAFWNFIQAGASTVSLQPSGGFAGDKWARMTRLSSTDPCGVRTGWATLVKPNETVVVSAWLYLTSDPAVIVHSQAWMELLGDDTTVLGSVAISDLPLDQWVRRSVTITVAGGWTGKGARARVFAGNPYIAGDIVSVGVDAVQVEVIDSSLASGDMETTITSGTVAPVGGGWFLESYGSPTMDTTTKHSGTKSIRLSSPSPRSWHVASQEVSCAGMTTFDLEFYWLLENVTAAHAKVTFFDGAHQVLQHTPGSPLGTTVAGGVDAFDNGFSYFMPGGTQEPHHVPSYATSPPAASAWTHFSWTGLPIPAGAAYLRISLLGGWSFDGVNDPYTWVDDVALTLHGTIGPSTWTPGGWSGGGFSGSQTVLLERSIDGGSTWTDVRFADLKYPEGYPNPNTPWRIGASSDHEAPPNTPVLYRTRATATLSGGGQVASPWWVYPDGVVLVPEWAWLKDPLDHSVNTAIDLQLPLTTRKPERQTTFMPLGRKRAVVLRDALLGEEGTLDIDCTGDAQWKAIDAVRAKQRTVLIQTPAGFNHYANLGETRELESEFEPDATTAIRHVLLPFVEADAPS